MMMIKKILLKNKKLVQNRVNNIGTCSTVRYNNNNNNNMCTPRSSAEYKSVILIRRGWGEPDVRGGARTRIDSRWSAKPTDESLQHRDRRCICLLPSPYPLPRLTTVETTIEKSMLSQYRFLKISYIEASALRPILLFSADVLYLTYLRTSYYNNCGGWLMDTTRVLKFLTKFISLHLYTRI